MTSFQPVNYIAGETKAGILFICDHASNKIPLNYHNLGLPPEAFERHIAYDIGAADIVRDLAARFQAPAILANFSRLLIDANRGEDDPTLVMRISDGALIPGNAAIDREEILRRITLYWRPYRRAIEQTLATMEGPPCLIISLHSFTPIWRNRPRIWQAGVLWDADPRVAHPLLAALGDDPAIAPVGDNQPYDGALKGDTLNEFGVKNGRPHALIEIRQDLIDGRAGQKAWADRLERALKPLIGDPLLRRRKFYPSRAR